MVFFWFFVYVLEIVFVLWKVVSKVMFIYISFYVYVYFMLNVVKNSVFILVILFKEVLKKYDNLF